MVGRELIKLLFVFFFPFILCNGGEFKKFTDAERKLVQEQCGKFEKQEEGILSQEINQIKYLIIWISPYHFLIDVNFLQGTFDTKTCESQKRVVTLKSNDFSARFIGDCTDISNGMLLMNSKAIKKDEIKKWLCIHEKVQTIGESVEILTTPLTGYPGNIVKCDNPKDSIFCIQSYGGNTGPVIIFSDKEHSIAGRITNAKNKDNMEVFNLYNYRDQICEDSGICVGSSSTSDEKSTTIETPSSTESSESTTLIVDPANSSVSPESSTSSMVASESTVSESGSSSETTGVIVVTLPASEPPTTEDTKTSEVSTTVEPATSSDSLPSDEPTTVPESKTSKPPVSSESIEKVPTIPSNDPRAEALKTGNSEEVDCEEKNLCFDEDVFASAGQFNFIFAFFISGFMIM